MSTKPAARSIPPNIDSQEYMRRILEAQGQIARLEMQVQETSADTRATVRTAEPLIKVYAELRSTVKDLRDGLNFIKIEKFAKTVLAPDIQVMIADTKSLGQRIKLLSRELTLKDRMIGVLRLPLDMRNKETAASTLRSRASGLSILASHKPGDTTPALICHMLAAQATLRQRAADLEKSTPRAVEVDSPTLPPTSTSSRLPAHRRDPTPRDAPSVSAERARDAEVNPGKFLHSMVRTLTENDFRKTTLETGSLLALILRVPSDVRQEIFNNTEAAFFSKENTFGKDDLRVLVDAMIKTSVYATYQQELERSARASEAPGERSLSPTTRGSSSPSTPLVPMLPSSSPKGRAMLEKARAPSGNLAVASSVSRTSSSLSSSRALSSSTSPAKLPLGSRHSSSHVVAPLASPPSVSRSSVDACIANMKESAKLLLLISFIDTNCRDTMTKRERTLFPDSNFCPLSNSTRAKVGYLRTALRTAP